MTGSVPRSTTIPIDDDNPEWTEEDFARAKPSARFPSWPISPSSSARAAARSSRRVKKRRVTIMLDPDVIEHFKAGGKGWQTRINAALRKAAGL